MKGTIEDRHKSLVTGGYAEMKPESRIKYHTQITIESVIEEIEYWMCYCENTKIAMKERIEELKQQI